MKKPALWFHRRFGQALDPAMFPGLVERLRGCPARVRDKVRSLSPSVLTERIDERWSIQENIGHLLDLEELWNGRIDDLLTGKAELRPADLDNRRTHEARHNQADIEDLLERFQENRLRLVDRLDHLDESQVSASALHPRLKQPMSVNDLCFFVAEHDDHHLATMTQIARRLSDR